jgi:hypothetical protein
MPEENQNAQPEEKDSAMLDVHPVHKSIHDWRDFLLHLATITIGLFIALSLEGLIEWRHHRNLVHEAEASLSEEIRANANGLGNADEEIKKQYVGLKADVEILKQVMATGKTPPNSQMEIAFHIREFVNLSWKTAQSTNALSYMSYSRAKEYAEIYATQDKLEAAENQAARDAIISLAPFTNMGEKEGPSRADAPAMKAQIEILQAQLLLVDSLVTKLNGEYKKFLAAHPASQ